MNHNYTVYHLHTEYSLLDSCTSYKDYIDKAVELGQTAIGFSEHGNILGYFYKWSYCKQKGIKYLHGIEVYLTETLDEKIRDNYHTILIAKNRAGFEEINTLSFLSTREDHVYYKPRLTFEEFLNISDNVIKISACVQSPLNKYKNKIIDNHTEEQKNMLIKLLKHYDYYEIQYHNMEEQIEFNKYLYRMSKKFNKPLIVGTDTHSLNSYKAECRTMLQYGKTDGVWGDEENSCDLTFKTYDELVACFKEQDSLPMDVVLQAIENTNVMADSVEELDFDTSNKYPILYGEKDEEVLWDVLKKKYKEKLARGEITKDQRYIDNIKEEMAVFKKTDMTGFMLFMSELLTWVRENGIATGFARGSCSGSTVAFISDITDVDPIKWNTVFSRFCNEHRVEIGDIDLDFYEDDRPIIYQHIIDRFGIDKTAYILALGTLADKAVIDTIGKAFRVKYGNETQYTLDKIAEIKKEYDSDAERTKKEYPDLFYYYDGLKNCIVSQSQHPAGIIVSPITLANNFGMFYGKEGQQILPIDMEECHELGLVKYDILGLKSVGVIDKTYKLVGKKFPKAYTVDWEDQEVYKDMTNDHTAIFQFESDFSGECLKTMDCHNIFDLSLVNACIRPSGTSYRDKLLNKIPNKNPSKIIDDLLKENYGWLVYQEDTIAFLQQICGFSGSDADNVRRAIGRKQIDRLNEAMPKILDGYCSKSDKPREVAEEEARQFLKVIEDSSSYQFGKNHSVNYSMLSYLMGYLRHYYPAEFCTSYLNCAKNDDDLYNGTMLAKSRNCKVVNPKFGFSSSEYGCDSSTKTIYKGLASIKNIGADVGDKLYDIKDFNFTNFIDVLSTIDNNKICNARELTILISINFFEQFGNPNQLLKIVDVYNKFINAKQLSKNKLTQREMQVVHQYAKKETPKQFKELDNLGIIYALMKEITDTTSPLEQISYDLQYLGYTTSTYNCNYFGVEDFELNKYGTPYVKLYRISTGESMVYKIDKKWYNEFTTEYHGELKQGDILDITLQEKPKRRKVDDEWVEVGSELVVTAFCRV